MATFDSKPFATAPLRAGYVRADVELHEVDIAVPSYEGRIFLGNPDADRTTPRSEEAGYVGSFNVFGKVDCWGEDEDHCAKPSTRKFDLRRAPTRLVKLRVRTPDGVVRRLAERAGDETTLHVVAVVPENPAYADRSPADVLRFSRIAIVTYA